MDSRKSRLLDKTLRIKKVSDSNIPLSHIQNLRRTMTKPYSFYIGFFRHLFVNGKSNPVLKRSVLFYDGTISSSVNLVCDGFWPDTCRSLENR